MNVDLRKPFWLVQGDPDRSTNWMVLNTYNTSGEAEQARKDLLAAGNPVIAKQGVFVYRCRLTPVYPETQT